MKNNLKSKVKNFVINGFLLIFILLISSSVLAASTDDFVITVKTNNTGSSTDYQFTIPTYSGETYNYNVDCNNDGTDEATGVTGDYTCDYGVGNEGTYTIRIKTIPVPKQVFPEFILITLVTKIKFWLSINGEQGFGPPWLTLFMVVLNLIWLQL